MSPTKLHPGHEEWISWIEGAAEPPDAARLETHLRDCAPCRGTVSLLREIISGGRVRSWADPPKDRVERAAALPAEPAIRPPGSVERVEWQPAGVRGAGIGAAGSARIATRVFDEGEVGILVTPPDGDDRWTIRGKVWLRQGTGPARVLLVHGDHVVASAVTDSAMNFTIEEILPPGWRLEIHLPNGRGLTVEEPTL